MYLVGLDPARHLDAARRVENLLATGERLVSDAEVLQEILHRFISIRRLDAIQPAFDTLLGIVDEVLPVDREAMEWAKQIAMNYRRLSARDCVHAGIMRQHGIDRILSYDSGFDSLPGITRLY